MEITHSLENEILIFAIKGRLDAATAPMAEETIKEKALTDERILNFIDGKAIKKVIVVKHKLVNIVLG